MFADPKHFPWTMLMNPSYVTEGHIYAKHILATRPDAKTPSFINMMTSARAT